MRKILILFNCLYGHLLKLCINLGVLTIPYLRTNCNCNIVVSLTSYGRRVKEGVVYYTLVSLLRQKVQPKRIILWLAETEWTEDTLPANLRQLEDKGVEIRYCPDIHSYKKLIPVLKLCPIDNVLTVDDDVIYSSDLVEMAFREHKKYPNDIICFSALIPEMDNGIPQRYSRWKVPHQNVSDKLLFPVGVGGILYPPGSLHKDVLDDALFGMLCPSADDIWFWFNSMRRGTIKHFVRKRGRDYSFDALYQYFHKGTALTQINRFEHRNDKQFINLFKYYDCVISTRDGLQYNPD